MNLFIFKRWSLITLVLAVAVTILTSCQGDERPMVELEQSKPGDRSIVRCPTPPKELQITEVKAEANAIAYKIGQLFQGEITGKITPQRIRQELHPQVANYEVVHYLLCVDYANGMLTKQDYNKFLAQVLPTLTEISPPPPAVHINQDFKSTHQNSPNIGIIGGDAHFGDQQAPER